jgi:hypothetical protein
MKKKIFIAYFSIVSIFLILVSFSYIYEEKLHSIIYEKYLPEIRITPKYSIETGEVVNKDEVTVWNDSDFVPWYGIMSYKIHDFIQFFGLFFSLFALLFYFPIAIHSGKDIKIGYWIVLTIELSMSFYFLISLFD